jgi:hypothetical protein
MHSASSSRNPSSSARRARGRLEAARVSPTRPHGRRDELRAARHILLDQTASLEAREAARETLVELLEAKRWSGRPAYSLRQAAAKALFDDPPGLCLTSRSQLEGRA